MKKSDNGNLGGVFHGDAALRTLREGPILGQMPHELWAATILQQEALLRLARAVHGVASRVTKCVLNGSTPSGATCHAIDSSLTLLAGEFAEHQLALDRAKEMFVWMPPAEVVEV